MLRLGEKRRTITNYGRHGLGKVIRGTVFPHYKCHKVTWVSSDHVTENQIHHITVSRQFRKCLEYVRKNEEQIFGMTLI
jgi:hypothetical protein